MTDVARPLLIATLACVLSVSASADSLTYSSSGADHNVLWGNQNGLSFSVTSVPSAQFQSSNPVAPIAQTADAAIDLTAGPLVQSTDTSWTFHGGTLTRGPGIGFSFSPIPVGFPSCEAAGLDTLSPGVCDFPAVITGNVGDVTLSLSDVVGTGFINTPVTIRDYTLSGTLNFRINDPLALVLGVTSGPYFGSFTITGQYSHSPATDPGFVTDVFGDFDRTHFITTTSMSVTGTTVPEPSSSLLLLTALGGAAASRTRRMRQYLLSLRKVNLGQAKALLC